MSLIYILLGLAVMFTDRFAEMVTPPYHYVLGLVLICYGVFRALRFYEKSRKTRYDEDNE